MQHKAYSGPECTVTFSIQQWVARSSLVDRETLKTTMKKALTIFQYHLSVVHEVCLIVPSSQTFGNYVANTTMDQLRNKKKCHSVTMFCGQER